MWNVITEETGEWWPRDFYVNPESTTVRIEARLGGHMFEDAGEGQGTIWGTVTQLKKFESPRLSAEMWPEYGGPARTIQRYDLSETEEGTMLRFTDTMYGRVSPSARKRMQDGWDYLMGKALKNYAEKAERPPLESPLSCGE